MNYPLLYKQVYPQAGHLRKRKVENTYYDFHTGKVSNVVKRYYEDISSSEKEIGKRIAIFTIIFCQILCLQRRVFQIYDFCDKELYYEISDFIEKYKFNLQKVKLFSERNIKVSKVIIHKYKYNKLFATTYILSDDVQKFMCLCVELDEVSNMWKIKNIKFPIGNNIKKFGKDV